MRKKPVAPCYQTLLPFAVVALKKLGGKTEKHKVLYQVMIDLNLAENAFDKAKKEMGWVGSRLRALSILKPVEKRGMWELADDSLMQMDDDAIKKFVKEQHRNELHGN